MTEDEIALASKRAREAIEKEHAQLRELLGKVGQTRELPQLLPQLEELRHLLVAHFETEDGPHGLHTAIARTEPRFVQSLEEISDEHQAFLGELDRMIALARACLDGPIATILRNVQDLSQRLHDHEVRENELLIQAAYSDLGGGS